MENKYNIPVNYNRSGYVLNGMVQTRKAVEAGVGALIGYIICNLLPLQGGIQSISYYILICGFFAMFGLAGIRGEPISTYFLNFCRWRKIRKKPYFYNPNGKAYSLSAADVMLESPDMRDKFADILDKMRSSLSSPEPEYIEGQTFRFAEDPLYERLDQAVEEKQKISPESSEAADKQSDNLIPDHTEQPENELNIEEIIDNIKLRQ